MDIDEEELSTVEPEKAEEKEERKDDAQDQSPKQGLLSPEDAKRYNVRIFFVIFRTRACISLTLHIQIKVILIEK